MSLRLASALFLAGALAVAPPTLTAQMSHDTQSARVQTSASDLRVALNLLLGEHAGLAAAATGAALGGRTMEFEAAAATLDANSVALSKAIGSVYGSEAEGAFVVLWRQHIGMLVNYATGVARKDKAVQDRAVNDLLGYATTLAVFLNRANPALPVKVLEDLVKSHIVSLKAVVDAQGRGEYAAAYSGMREAIAHMQMIADPLAEAIAKQYPEKFAAR